MSSNLKGSQWNALNVIQARKHEDFDLTGDLRVSRASGTPPLVRIDRRWERADRDSLED